METITSRATEGCQGSKLKRPLLPLQEQRMLVQVTCETKTPLPHHLHHASLMASLALEQSRLVWVSDIISNVIVCLQRGSQFHQGALLAVTSWEQNNPTLSQRSCPASQPASQQGVGADEHNGHVGWWKLTCTRLYSYLYVEDVTQSSMTQSQKTSNYWAVWNLFFPVQEADIENLLILLYV